MPLYFFYTMVQKSQKWPKNSNQGGGGPVTFEDCEMDLLVSVIAL